MSCCFLSKVDKVDIKDSRALKLLSTGYLKLLTTSDKDCRLVGAECIQFQAAFNYDMSLEPKHQRMIKAL